MGKHKVIHTNRPVTIPCLLCTQHLIVFPLMREDKKLVNIVAFYSEPEKEGQTYVRDAVRTCTKDEIIPRYEGWEEEVKQLLEVRN